MKIENIKSEKRLGKNKRINILGAEIDVLTARETVDLVENYVKTKTPLHLMGVNADKINAMQDDPLLFKIVNSCGVINADGASVVLASRFLEKALPERVAGIDLMQQLVSLSNQKGYSVYLLGAKPQKVKKTKCILEKKYPKI
ncbi:glycosyltransferase, partial [Limosilactobacillus reuteri]|uniref:WecB/TagA/CpsF family glycosyltransferase n=1 Tax=Limosilactobacillus reuteri TaxID=1598 RepID=UPI000BD6D17E